MTGRTIRWGILAAAGIASRFCASNRRVENSVTAAVAARSYEKAEQFAEKNGVPVCYGSYDGLLADESIDAVYVATVHTLHARWVKRALEAGKHVLCEKSFGMSPQEAEECAALAKEKGLFLMEAMWTKFLPIYDDVRLWIDSGLIGRIRQIRADFSFKGSAERLFTPELGGGGLLDTGVYPLNFACMFLGYDPVEVTGTADVRDGVDVASAFTLKYRDGGLALLSCGVNFNGPQDGVITGDCGSIRIKRFWEAEKAELYDENEELVNTAYASHGGAGFSYEIDEAVRCILSGRVQSEVMPMEYTVKISRMQRKLFDVFGIYKEYRS